MKNMSFHNQRTTIPSRTNKMKTTCRCIVMKLGKTDHEKVLKAATGKRRYLDNVRITQLVQSSLATLGAKRQWNRWTHSGC